MEVYAILLTLGLFFLFITRINRELQYVSGVSFMVMLGFVAAFRYDVGMDYFAYELLYDDMVRHEPGEIEVGFWALCRFCELIGGTPQLMFALLSAGTLCLFYRGFRYFSNDLVLTIFIFMCIGQMYLNCFNAMRQTVAIALFLNAMTFIPQRKIWMYMLCVALGTCFHNTAIILAPLYWLLPLRINKIMVIAAAGVLAVSSTAIVQLILNSASGYESYLFAGRFITDTTAANYLYLAMSVGIFAFAKWLMPDNPHRNIYQNLNTLSMFCFVLYFVFSGTPVMIVITRLSYYFMIGYALSLPAIIRSIDGRAIQLSSTAILVGVLIFLFVRSTIVKGEEYNLLPFDFNFQLF